jgi:pimeloyl-ACP methyl ester carboxylesterase
VGWRQHTLQHRELTLAVQEHGPADGFPVLALHGWRDNSASFDRLAALMPQQRIIALDFPGHGLSSRRHVQASYSLWSYVDEVALLVQQFCPDGCILLGHSMGGAVACLYAALFPEHCRRLVMLDMAGPIATKAQDAPAQMREAWEQLQTRKLNWRKHYTDRAAAVDARASRGLAPDAALALAERGLAQDEHGWYWDMDPRLAMKNPLSLTEEHAQAFMQRIACPVLVVAARRVWEARMDWFERRLSYLGDVQMHMLDGSHHQHMEAEAPQVAELVEAFIRM